MLDAIAPRRTAPYATCQFVVRVGDAKQTIRAAAVWPIAEVLGCEDQMDAVLSGAADGVRAAEAAGIDVGLMHDLLDSSMIAPPRPRRRRERALSSRALFFQTAAADD
jgi:hypothetical protein